MTLDELLIAGVSCVAADVDFVAEASSSIQAALPAKESRRARRDYLNVLQEMIVEDEVCPAEVWLRNFYGSWHCSMERVIEFLRIA